MSFECDQLSVYYSLSIIVSFSFKKRNLGLQRAGRIPHIK